MVTKDEPTQTFNVGDRVAVPWGLDVLEGTVVSTYGSGRRQRVVVSVRAPGSDDDSPPDTVTLPAQLLQEAAATAAARRPGEWLSAYRYERKLADAFERVIREIAGDSADLGQQHHKMGGAGADFVAVIGDHIVVVEAKTSQHLIARDAIHQLIRYLQELSASDLRRVGLLVSNAKLSRSAIDEIVSAEHAGAIVRAVQWNSDDDNMALAQALREVLAA